jgi:hypothetical protein
MMKRIVIVGLLLCALLLVLVSCDVIKIDVETTINEDGSSSFSLLFDETPDPETGCPVAEEGDLPSQLVDTPQGPVCRSVALYEFGQIAELQTFYTEFEGAVVVSCLEMVDGEFYFDGALVLEESEGDESGGGEGELNIRFTVPGRVSSSNAHRQDGNTLVWTVNSATPFGSMPMLINMNAGESCPSADNPAEEESEEEAEQESEEESEEAEGSSEEEASEEESTGLEEIALDPFISKLSPDLGSKIYNRMDCTNKEVDDDDCRPLNEANNAANSVRRDLESQLPENKTAAVESMLFYIKGVTIIAFSRDDNDQLIFPTLNASMPVVIQMAWNAVDSPEDWPALSRYIAILTDYDNRRYAADHGE